MNGRASTKRGLWTPLIATGVLALLGFGCRPAVDETGSPGVEAPQNQSPQHPPPPPQGSVENGPGMNQPPPPPQSNAENGSGMIQPPAAADLLNRLDKDGDGKISENEFDGPAEHFSQFDTNGDGYLTEDEIPDGPPRGQGPPQGQRPPQGQDGPQGQHPPRGAGPPPGQQQTR